MISLRFSNDRFSGTPNNDLAFESIFHAPCQSTIGKQKMESRRGATANDHEALRHTTYSNILLADFLPALSDTDRQYVCRPYPTEVDDRYISHIAARPEASQGGKEGSLYASAYGCSQPSGGFKPLTKMMTKSTSSTVSRVKQPLSFVSKCRLLLLQEGWFSSAQEPSLFHRCQCGRPCSLLVPFCLKPIAPKNKCVPPQSTPILFGVPQHKLGPR